MEVHPESIDPEVLPPACRKLFEPQNEALKRQQADNEALRAQVGWIGDSNRRLEPLISELRRLMYRRKSGKLDVDDRQMSLAFEDLEGAIGEVQAEVGPSAPASPPARKRRAPRRNLGQLPRHLPRVGNVIKPDSIECPCGCGGMVRIGEDRSERLDIVPARLRVIVTVRPKYVCRGCAQGGGSRRPRGAHRSGRAAHRGDAGAGARIQACGPFAALPPVADSRPRGGGKMASGRSQLDQRRSTLSNGMAKKSNVHTNAV